MLSDHVSATESATVSATESATVSATESASVSATVSATESVFVIACCRCARCGSSASKKNFAASRVIHRHALVPV